MSRTTNNYNAILDLTIYFSSTKYVPMSYRKGRPQWFSL
jgi:hypothetical protein